MSWIALADAHGADFNLLGLSYRIGSPKSTPRAPENHPKFGKLACRGTLLLEAPIARYNMPRTLLDHSSSQGFSLRIACTEADTLSFALEVDGTCWKHSLPLSVTPEAQIVRISFAWDSAIRAGVLSVFQPQTNHLAQVLVSAPRPLPWMVLEDAIHAASAACQKNQLNFVAISRAFEPTGPMPGLGAGTRIATPNGPKSISRLGAGDTVLCTQGVAHRILRRIERTVPARGSFAPQVMRAPFLGLTQNVTVSAESLVALGGPDVEYLLGIEHVLAHVALLKDGRNAHPLSPRGVICYHQLVLETVEMLDAEIGIASFNLGVASPDRMASATTLWADLPHHIPGHGALPHPVARPYEVATLNAARAA